MLKLDQEQIRRLRLRANGLVDSSGDSAARIASRVCGLQAQERLAAELAVHPRARDTRSGGPRLNDVQAMLDGATGDHPDVVRTWAMRGTLHLLAAEDIGWMLSLLGPVFVRKGARRRRQLGLDEAICARATAMMRDYLDGRNALTRADLAQKLGAEGIPVQGQALYHLLYRAALEGVICFGPDRDGEHTFVLLQSWLGIDVLSEEGQEETSSHLARRYLQGYGPATARDFASWSGLGLREARQAFEELQTSLLEVQGPAGETLALLAEQAAWLDEPQSERIEARLLPAYDSFLLGYERRHFLVDEAYARQIHPGGGVIHPTVLLNGHAVGVWRLHRQKLNVEITPFEPFNKEASDAVALQVRALHRYIGIPAS